MSEQWLYNILTLLVIISVMSILLKLQKPTKRPEKNNPTDYVLTKGGVNMPADTKGAELCEAELLAVITAAIHAFTGSAEFKVVRVKRCSNNWTLFGRQIIMTNRI